MLSFGHVVVLTFFFSKQFVKYFVWACQTIWSIKKKLNFLCVQVHAWTYIICRTEFTMLDLIYIWLILFVMVYIDRIWGDSSGLLCHRNVRNGLRMQPKQLVHLHWCEQIHILGLLPSYRESKPYCLWLYGQKCPGPVSLILIDPQPSLEWKYLKLVRA